MTPLMESGCSFDFSFCLTLFFTYSVIPNTCSYFKCIETSFAKLPDWKASLQRCRSPWSWYQPPPEHHGWLWLTSLTHSRVLRLCFQPRRPAAHGNAPPGSDVKPLEAGGPGSGPALAAARCAVWGSRAGLKRKGNVKWFKWGIIPQIANFKKKQLLQIVCKQLLCWNSTRAVLNDKCWKEKSVQREAVILPQEKKNPWGREMEIKIRNN